MLSLELPPGSTFEQTRDAAELARKVKEAGLDVTVKAGGQTIATLPVRLKVWNVELPSSFAEAATIHRTIMEADLAHSFAAEYARGREVLTPTLRTMIERGQRTLATEYRRAVEQVSNLLVNTPGDLAGRFETGPTVVKLATVSGGQFRRTHL